MNHINVSETRTIGVLFSVPQLSLGGHLTQRISKGNPPTPSGPPSLHVKTKRKGGPEGVGGSEMELGEVLRKGQRQRKELNKNKKQKVKAITTSSREKSRKDRQEMGGLRQRSSEQVSTWAKRAVGRVILGNHGVGERKSVSSYGTV